MVDGINNECTVIKGMYLSLYISKHCEILCVLTLVH